jgi:hypothetical protein
MRFSKIKSPRKVVGSFLSFIFFTVFTLPLFAQETLTEENSNDLYVKYLEGNNDALRFNLRYNNTSGDDFKVMVLNETGEVLFQKMYSGKNFRKKIKLTRLTDSDAVTFLVRPSKESIQLSYKVRIPSKVVDRSTALAD